MTTTQGHFLAPSWKCGHGAEGPRLLSTCAGHRGSDHLLVWLHMLKQEAPHRNQSFEPLSISAEGPHPGCQGWLIGGILIPHEAQHEEQVNV